MWCICVVHAKPTCRYMSLMAPKKQVTPQVNFVAYIVITPWNVWWWNWRCPCGSSVWSACYYHHWAVMILLHGTRPSFCTPSGISPTWCCRGLGWRMMKGKEVSSRWNTATRDRSIRWYLHLRSKVVTVSTWKETKGRKSKPPPKLRETERERGKKEAILKHFFNRRQWRYV